LVNIFNNLRIIIIFPLIIETILDTYYIISFLLMYYNHKFVILNVIILLSHSSSSNNTARNSSIKSILIILFLNCNLCITFHNALFWWITSILLDPDINIIKSPDRLILNRSIRQLYWNTTLKLGLDYFNISKHVCWPT